jgi:hypothetical protein
MGRRSHALARLIAGRGCGSGACIAARGAAFGSGRVLPAGAPAVADAVLTAGGLALVDASSAWIRGTGGRVRTLPERCRKRASAARPLATAFTAHPIHALGRLTLAGVGT